MSDIVERELRERPHFSSRLLQELAANVDSSIREMDPRLFHAEIVVPAQRRIDQEAAANGKRTRKGKRARGRTRTGRASGASRRRTPNGAAERQEPQAVTGPPAPEPETGAPTTPRDEAVPIAAPSVEVTTSREIDAQPDAVTSGAGRRTVRRTGARRRADRSTERKRSAAREAFYDWARALAEAKSSGEMVTVLSEVDRFIDRMLDDSSD